MQLHSDGTLRAFALAGDTQAQAWVLELLQQGVAAAAFGRALLAASATPPQALTPRSAQVCSCVDVSEERIVQTLGHCGGSAEERLRALQSKLRCGTECGSCMPALRTLEKRHPALEPA